MTVRFLTTMLQPYLPVYLWSFDGEFIEKHPARYYLRDKSLYDLSQVMDYKFFDNSIAIVIEEV